MAKDTNYFLKLYRRRHAAGANTPYTPPPSNCRPEDSFDPSPADIQAYFLQYEDAYAAGIMLTGVHGIPGLTKWFRPVVTSKAGAMRQLPASRFESTPNLELPLCPHASNSFCTTEECMMKCKKVVHVAFFNALITIVHSRVRFFPLPFLTLPVTDPLQVIIPPVAPANIFLNEQDLNAWINSPEFIGKLLSNFSCISPDLPQTAMLLKATKGIIRWSSMTAPSPFTEEVESYSTSSPSSSDTLPSSSSSSNSLPSSPSSNLPPYSLFSSPTHSSPRRSTGFAVAYFSPSVAERRSSPDHSIIGRTLNEEEAGYYKTHPEMHNLQKLPLPEFLLPYQPATSVHRLADMMQYMTSPTGQIITYFTSTVGVPYVMFLQLKQESILCIGCNCMFSIQGYHGPHRSYGRCTGNVDLPLIPERFPAMEDVPFLQFRSYPPGVPVPTSQEFLNTTIGRALVEWNTRIGIPLDVWHTISTDCQDIGQGQMSAIVKGKSRAVVLYRMD
ncbi:hypothetical protein B0H19DRAFT_1321063 [Mycena capillaripes]|nr:hypothetical protein B0H19DRAFT_1321063 [Mycena capillaripes]